MRAVLHLIIVAVLAAALPAAAADETEEVFTFKRVGVPKPGAKRITVQIDPEEQARILAALSARSRLRGDGARPGDRPAEEPVLPASPRPAPDGAAGADAPKIAGRYAWYWQTVSPSIQAAGQGRFFDALAALDKAPADATVSSPRLNTLQRIADLHGAEILKATIGTRVSPALVLAVIAVESGGNAAAKSHAGASGLMQLMPDTATRFGVTEATDPAQNIRGGVAYLDWLMGEFGQDALLALAGYNAGEGAVRKNSGVPPYAETRDYVPKVLAAWKVARGLCLTPPELPGDGCVFASGRRLANG